MMNEDLLQQRKDQIAKSMTRAGIGTVYHQRSLSEFGDTGKELLARINEPGFIKGMLRNGAAFAIRAKTLGGYDLPFVLARALRLARVDARVVTPLSFLNYAKHDGDLHSLGDEKFIHFERTQALFISRFYEVMDERPLTRTELYRIEELLNNKIDDGMSVSVQFTGDLTKQNWYSEYTVSRILANTTKVVL